ncbi:hypothetical protein KAI92_04610 [Candidatus Parcubacteria bacterium]|nr:hypothetical protein [Candidatus Parcubacteria bacterium]
MSEKGELLSNRAVPIIFSQFLYDFISEAFLDEQIIINDMFEIFDSLSKNELIAIAIVVIILFSYFLYRILGVIAIFAFLFFLLFIYTLHSTGSLAFLKSAM